jgi:hypothetical protein
MVVVAGFGLLRHFAQRNDVVVFIAGVFIPYIREKMFSTRQRPLLPRKQN